MLSEKENLADASSKATKLPEFKSKIPAKPGVGVVSGGFAVPDEAIVDATSSSAVLGRAIKQNLYSLQ